jgi:hypothetical protein
MPKTIVRIPPKNRFTLPEVLEHLKPLDLTREDLFEYLWTGRLSTVCYPYRLEPEREIPIEPNEWTEWFRDSWEFPVYAGWIGDKNVDGGNVKVPLHIVPRAARDDCNRKLKDGGPATTSAAVYVLRDELVRFSKWLQNARKSRRGPRRKGAGRPRKHDYSEIDACLESLLQKEGRGVFVRPRDIIANLEEQLGRASLPHDSTLRNHIKVWLRTSAASTGA